VEVTPPVADAASVGRVICTRDTGRVGIDDAAAPVDAGLLPARGTAFHTKIIAFPANNRTFR
jgi:hypothetical protein